MNVFTFANDALAQEAKTILRTKDPILTINERRDILGQPQLYFESTFVLGAREAKYALRRGSWLYHQE